MMPKFIGNDSLIARINEVEGCIYRQSNELGRLNKAVRRYKAENAKLRDLVYSILKCAGEIDRDRGCDVCPMNTDGDLESYLDGTWCKLRPTLREVGFEVE